MNPFEVLGLAASSQVTDDEVRSAWRRIAGATHPDRADGGQPAAFAEAAAAYTALRTAAGRGEALADLRGPASRRVPDDPVPRQKNPLARLLLAATQLIRHGRPARLVLRLLAAAATGALAVAAAGWQPASLAVITGALTWLWLTGRSDLASGSRPAGKPVTPRGDRKRFLMTLAIALCKGPDRRLSVRGGSAHVDRGVIDDE